METEEGEMHVRKRELMKLFFQKMKLSKAMLEFVSSMLISSACKLLEDFLKMCKKLGGMIARWLACI